MSVIKAYDVAYVRFRAPDLDQMRSFLIDFGMQPVAPASSDDETLYMAGCGRAPFVHATERGDPGFAALGIWANSRADVERLAAHEGVEVQQSKAPGGGVFARLTDPDGFVLEVTADQQLNDGPGDRFATEPWNQGGKYPRVARFRRAHKGPSHVQRLGHCVLGVSDFRASERWYKDRFGLVTSDEIQVGESKTIGAFLRCDRGDEPCDHHTIFLFEHPKGPDFMHAAFEVADFDDLMSGHDHLKAAGRAAHWGVGRHTYGSQIFDYWLDPWGHEVEHWTDGDQLRASDGGGVGDLEKLLGVQWGMANPVTPEMIGN